MPACISHSFENQPEFHNIADALRQAEVEYWHPGDVKPGASLREQLRTAVQRCDVCIFIATRQSIQAIWCGAELGAFWGAGKTVIVYVADPSLTDDALPPIVQGDVWERRISRVVGRAKEVLAEAKSGSQAQSTTQGAQVGSMTVEQLERLIVGAVSLAAATTKNTGHRATPEAFGQAAQGMAGHVLRGIRKTHGLSIEADQRWQKQILWVDDRPDNNIYE